MTLASKIDDAERALTDARFEADHAEVRPAGDRLERLEEAYGSLLDAVRHTSAAMNSVQTLIGEAQAEQRDQRMLSRARRRT